MAYSPFIKNANNIFDINNYQRNIDNEKEEKNKYISNLKKDQFNTEYNMINKETEANYLENKYLYDNNNTNDKNKNSRDLDTNLQVQREDFILEKINQIDNKQIKLNEIKNSIQGVNNFSLHKEIYSSQQQQNKHYNYLPNINYDYVKYQKPNQLNNYNESRESNKKETFANTVDQNNRNMIHLLRKY